MTMLSVIYFLNYKISEAFSYEKTSYMSLSQSMFLSWCIKLEYFFRGALYNK